MIIQVRNNLTETAQKSFLSTSVNAGTPVIPLKNINAFAASWGIQIGETGEEQSEILLLGTATVAGTAGTTTTNTVYSHPADTPVYAIKYNQILFKRSTSGTAGTATVMTDGTVSIKPDSEYTVFEDTTALPTYAYKTIYYNSPLASSSEESDWILPTGYSQYSLANIRQRVRNRLWDSSYLTDDVIDEWINEWKDEMVNTAIKVNKDYALGSTNVAFSGTQEIGTITATDFKSIRRVWMTTDGSNYYRATQLDLNDFQPDYIYSDTMPCFYHYGDLGIGRKPSNASGTACIIYYKLYGNLTNDTDELPSMMKNYTKSFVDYCEAKALKKDNKSDEANNTLAMAEAGKARFEMEITPRHETGPESIKIVDDIQGEDYSFY